VAVKKTHILRGTIAALYISCLVIGTVVAAFAQESDPSSWDPYDPSTWPDPSEISGEPYYGNVELAVNNPPPGDPPSGFDWENAEVTSTQPYSNNGQYEEYDVICDANWCVIPDYYPENDPNAYEDEAGAYMEDDLCLNATGDICIFAPNSEETTAWVEALMQFYANVIGDIECSMSQECPIEFPIDGSYEEWLAALEAGEAPPPPAPPPAVYCPADTVELGEIRVTAELVAPPYPVVIGQDPAKRGADIQWRIEIDPTIHTWYEEIVHYDQRVCYSVPEGTGSGCPGPASRYDDIQGADRWFEWMENDSNWQSEGGQPRVECVKHVDVYVEQLNWVRPQVNLSQASREWIQHGELQDRYPGADLYQPDWEFSPGAGGTTTGSGMFIWEWINLRTQLKDPGFWMLSLRAMTTGTPMSGPRSINEGGGSFNVWMHEATLSE
jgi:hypothetical protein